MHPAAAAHRAQTASRGKEHARRLIATLGVTALVFNAAGCLAYKVVAAPVKLAANVVVVGAETATAVVTNSGKLATSAANATGTVGSVSIDAAAKLAQANMLTIVDGNNGAVTRVPWQQGLTLAAAGNLAQVELARRAIDVLRAGKVIFSGKATDATIASGDVVRLGK